MSFQNAVPAAFLAAFDGDGDNDVDLARAGKFLARF